MTNKQDWKEKLLESVFKLRQGKYISSDKISEQGTFKRNYPVYGGNGIRGYVDFYEYLERQVILTCRGRGCGLIQWLSPKSTITNSSIAFEIKNKEELYMSYVRYWALNERFDDVTSGSAQHQITIGPLGKKVIPIPHLPEQHAIVEVLSSLDNKIDLLHRQNKTLETLAETLFRQWFVEEAKEEWEEVCLSDICLIIIRGRTPTTLGYQLVDSGINFIKAESITDEGLFRTEKFAKISEDTHHKLKRSIVQTSDVLCSIASTIGRIAIVGDFILPANTNQSIAILRVNSKKCQPEFVYLFLKSDIFRNQMDGKIVHAVQPNLSLGELRSSKLRLPPPDMLRRFDEIINPIFKKKTYNTLEIGSLEKLRNMLLPKLIGGEVRVEYGKVA